jgi:hypothetical protein
MSLAENIVNVGTHAFDRTGDRGQVPFTKYNNAITELYTSIAAIIAGATFTFEQALPASTWMITHNLARFPGVTVVDSAGSEVMGEVAYVDANTITLIFSAPFSGTAYLN